MIEAGPVSRHPSFTGTFEQICVMSLVIENDGVAELWRVTCLSALLAMPLLNLSLRQAGKSGVKVVYAHCPAAEHLRLLP